jgi:hypothetical protein
VTSLTDPCPTLQDQWVSDLTLFNCRSCPKGGLVLPVVVFYCWLVSGLARYLTMTYMIFIFDVYAELLAGQNLGGVCTCVHGFG